MLVSHSLQLRWRLGLISADDEKGEEDGEQAAAGYKRETRHTVNTVKNN